MSSRGSIYLDFKHPEAQGRGLLDRSRRLIASGAYFVSAPTIPTHYHKLVKSSESYISSFSGVNSFANAYYSGSSTKVSSIESLGLTNSQAWRREMTTYQTFDPPEQATSVDLRIPLYTFEIPSWLLEKGFDVITAFKVFGPVTGPANDPLYDASFQFAEQDSYHLFVCRSGTLAGYDSDLKTAIGRISSGLSSSDAVLGPAYGKFAKLENMSAANVKGKATVIPDLYSATMPESVYQKTDASNENQNWFRWFYPHRQCNFTRIVFRLEKSEVLNSEKGSDW